MRAALIWASVLAAISISVIAAAYSPLLAWREPIYIAAGFAGILGMGLMLLQPLLVGGHLPGLPSPKGRRLHRLIGASILFAVVLHIAGLWITSPPDVVDVLLFRSPTPFGVWGALAMWAVFASAALAVFRKRGWYSLRFWRIVHTGLAVVIVLGTILHAVLIEGAMEALSKGVLSVCILAATLKVVVDLRAWTRPKR